MRRFQLVRVFNQGSCLSELFLNCKEQEQFFQFFERDEKMSVKIDPSFRTQLLKLILVSAKSSLRPASIKFQRVPPASCCFSTTTLRRDESSSVYRPDMFSVVIILLQKFNP